MDCLAPRRVWFYLLYPCSNDPCNSFNCFFLHFKKNQTNCYELYLSSRFYRIYTFNDICILHVVLVKATPDRLLKICRGYLFVYSGTIINQLIIISPLRVRALSSAVFYSSTFGRTDSRIMYFSNSL